MISLIIPKTNRIRYAYPHIFIRIDCGRKVFSGAPRVFGAILEPISRVNVEETVNLDQLTHRKIAVKVNSGLV